MSPLDAHDTGPVLVPSTGEAMPLTSLTRYALSSGAGFTLERIESFVLNIPPDDGPEPELPQRIQSVVRFPASRPCV